jgi:uncharacterized membrane protein
MIRDFIFFGVLGWILEILWTGSNSAFKGDRRLMGFTSLYMFPIYGCAVFLEGVFFKAQSMNFVFRGLIYMVCIFSAEYVSGFLTEKIAGVCPWDYSKEKFNIDGFIRLDYAPLWFIVGLIFEYAFKEFLI